MPKKKNESLPINCTGADINNDVCKAVDKNVVQQFTIIMAVVFILLVLFLGFFVYNLIRCYLPKWRKNKLREETKSVEIR